MALSLTAKAALCLCPPALMAGTAATVPAVKRAVHNATAPRHARPVHRVVTAAAKPPVAPAREAVDCIAGVSAVPVVPLVTYASPIPDEPGNSGFFSSGAAPLSGGIGILAAPQQTPVTPPVVAPVTPPIGPVPEPATWLLMISGVGSVGLMLRRWRRRAADAAGRAGGRGARLAGAGVGASLWSGSAAVEAGDMAATLAVKSTVASVAGKALLCVCPAAVVAGSVVAVPPLRQAVHAVTAVPAAVAPTAPAVPAAVPCTEPMIPVSTATGGPASIAPAAGAVLNGYPPSVSTVRAASPASVPATAADATASAAKEV